MKEIKLTQNKVALVDDEDFEYLNQYKWRVMYNGSTWYAIRTIVIDGKLTTISMHREILNAPKGIMVDHGNGNGLYNYKENLRLCTNRQNQHNQLLAHKDSRIGIKGVSWVKKVKRFRATIQDNGKFFDLGYYKTAGAADIAYRSAEMKRSGEFARISTKILFPIGVREGRI